jgi:hypothetical protein
MWLDRFFRSSSMPEENGRWMQRLRWEATTELNQLNPDQRAA